MGMLSAIGDFLFGKAPDIFDNNGNVTHKLTKRTWDAWNNRIKMDPNSNWRNHVGIRSAKSEKRAKAPNQISDGASEN